MCGIAGFSGSFQPELLSVMSRVLAHRGPDAGDHLFLPAQQLGLLHRRLSIIDPSPLGNQPMWDEEGRVCLVYNGEIYNFQELRRELEGEGVVFRSGTDSEVLLQLYRKYGRECLSLLNGMFAFALWDSARGELFLARDELGIKPLYLAHTPKGFLFASEIKALLAEPSLSRAVRPEAVATHIQYLWTPGPHTLFRDVVKLPPGEAVVVSDGKIREQWQYTPSRVAKSERFVSGEEESETLRAVLSRAVQRQLVADVPLGAFLSGGLDSSFVVALARQHRERHELPCFTIALDEQESRREGMTADLPYARRVAKHLDVPLEELRVGSEVIEHLPMMIAQLDEPVADLAPLNVLLISQAAHRAGMKVLLSGAGGDDLFTGYRRHRALLLSKYWGWLPQGFRSRMASFAGHLPSSPHAFRRLRKLLELAGGSEAEQCIGYFHWLSTPLLRGLLSEEFLATAQRDPVEQFYHTLSPALSPLEKMLALEQRFFLADHNLMYTDKMSMAAGVEVRVPLLDQEVVRYASQLPDTFLQRGSEGKWILKKAAEQYLPRDVIYRPKTGFGTPLRAWMGGPLRPLREELLSKEVVESRGWLSFPALARLMAEHDQGKRDATYPLFALLCLELWARRTIDGSISSFGQTRGDKTQSDLRASG